MSSDNREDKRSLKTMQILATWQASRQERNLTSGPVPLPDVDTCMSSVLQGFLANASSCEIIVTTSPGKSPQGEELRLTVDRVAACNITSETVKAQPAPRDRRRIAVGEEVILTYSGDTANWATTAGRVSPAAGKTVRFTAPDTAQNVTITAQGTCGNVTINFTIVSPSAIDMQMIPGSLRHKQNRPDIGMQTNIWIGPADVNFYNIEWKELEIGATATGVYSCLNGRGHGPGAPVTLSDTVVAGRGTLVNAIDNIYSGDCLLATPPFTPGHIQFNIPNQYRVGAGAFRDFTTTIQRCELAANQSTLTADKAGAHAQTTVAAPTSP